MADEEVYADGYIRVPAKKWYHIADALTRRDDLMGAVLKVLGAINKKLIAVPTAPPAVPAPPVAPLAPPEWAPLTDRLDIITSDFRAYLSRIRGLPIARVGRVTTTGPPDTDWHTLVSWYIGIVWSKRYGMLREISIAPNLPAVTRFRFRIEMGEPTEEKVILFDELEIGAPLTLPFPENRLPYGTWVYLDCRSTGPIIVVDGSITGSEWRE